MYVCVLCGSQNKTAIISLYSINLSVFKTEAECLLRGTKWVFKSDKYSFVLKGLKYSGVNRSNMSSSSCNNLDSQINQKQIKNTYWNERTAKVKLYVGRGKLSVFAVYVPVEGRVEGNENSDGHLQKMLHETKRNAMLSSVIEGRWGKEY